MAASYSIGKFVGRHRLLAALVVGAVLVIASRAWTRDDAAASPPAATVPNPAERAAAAAAALRERCSTGYPAVLAEAKAARDKGDANAALELLHPCRDSAAGLENKALLAQVTATVEAAHKKKLAAEKMEFARAEQAEKARKKKEGVRIGMSKQDVLDSNWGRPERVNTTTTAAGSSEQWVYQTGNYLYFSNDVLTTIQN